MLLSRAPSRALLVGLLLVAVAAPALAHGAPTTVQKDAGPYAVTHYTFEVLDENEWVRLGWSAENRESGEPAELAGRAVTFQFLDENGGVVREESMELAAGETRATADLYLDSGGSLRSTLDLGDAQVTFTQEIQPAFASEPPVDDGADDEGDNETPGVGLVLALAAVGAVALTRRAR